VPPVIAKVCALMGEAHSNDIPAKATVNPPRNGEVARHRRDGGVDPGVFGLSTSFAGPPPRPGEDL